MIEFIEFPKMSRFDREIIITEKLDGTNAQIYIAEDFSMLVGSRTRWITPENDNYGFAKWAYENIEELSKLGPGSHFGEWWGGSIQRRYGVKERTFSLFNTHRWSDETVRPKCCSVVPVIWRGGLGNLNIKELMSDFKAHGSYAVPGCMNPEGIVLFHTASQLYFKKTFEKDDLSKFQIEKGLS